MNKIVIGVFDSLPKVRKAVRDLVDSGFNHFGPIISIGPLAAALTDPLIHASAGGFIGALTGLGVPQRKAQYYAKVVKRGCKIVAVYVDDGMLKQAEKIMLKNNATVTDCNG